MKTTIDIAFKFPEEKNLNLPSTQAAKLAKERLSRVLTGDQLEVSPSQSGMSGMQCFSVLHDGRQSHLKLSPTHALLPTAAVAREFANASWAAERGLGPKVQWSSDSSQALLTEFVPNQAKASQGTRLWGPVTKATVRALATLHRSEQGAVRPFDAEQHLGDFNLRLDEAKNSNQTSPIHLSQIRAMAYEIIGQLSRFPVQEQLCHGDMNGCNSIFSAGKVHFIDWESLKLGDPIYELAYFAFHIGCDMEQMPRLWKVYSGRQGRNSPELYRLRLQLALFHCTRYAMRVTGMPWHKSSERQTDLELATAQLNVDARVLGLSGPPSTPDSQLISSV